MDAPPTYTSTPNPPPAGLRIPSVTHQAFPPLSVTGEAPCTDLNGEPVWVCSALMGTKSVQPCKCAGHLPRFVRVPYGGEELEHNGRYDILPITSDMEWVPASNGQLPKGRRPVEGGYEESGAYLYHALVYIAAHEISVPGKTGEHLGAAHCAFGGEHIQRDNYKVLCWRP